MSAILEFYRGEKTLDGDSLFDITRNWTDEKWEFAHDYIQWVFPLREPSNFNPDAPLLTEEDLLIFSVDEELHDELFIAFHRFLLFLGLRCRYNPEEARWITEQIPAGAIILAYGNSVKYSEDEADRKNRVWTSPNHNWLRITRCLWSLRLLGMEKIALSFYACLAELYLRGSGITYDTFQYWTKAVSDPVA
jgi:hypothetical protein